MEDIRQTGTQGLKGINKNEVDFLMKQTPIRTPAYTYAGVDIPLTSSTGDYGSSKFDENIITPEQLYDIGTMRAENQSAIGKLANGVIKGVGLTGTTFLDGTVGALVGIGKGISNMLDEDEDTGFWDGLWNNEFSKAMKTVNDEMEKIFVNHYSRDEIENPTALRNIFSANFLGDKFIKNLGFTIGAYYSGKAFSSLLNMSRIPAVTRAITGSARAPKMIMSGTGAIVSAFNEGRIEALNNSTDWGNLEMAKEEEKYKSNLAYINENYLGTPQYEEYVNAENDRHSKTLERIEIDKAKMGNMDMLLNVPILTASNLFQFGKLYANGFKTARKSLNTMSKLGVAAKSIGVGLSEGLEEVSQALVSDIAGFGYSQDVRNFYTSKINPEAEKQTIDWIKAIGEGMNATMNDKSTLEEFLIGSLTGFLGMPTFGKVNTSQTAWLGKGKTVGLSGGIGGEIAEARENNERVTKIQNYIQSRIEDDENFKKYYQGLIRHTKLQNDMNNAAAQNNAFDFKNAEFDQLVSDLMMFDTSGKLEDYITLIESAFDTSDENLQAIIENTTQTEGENKVGPFIDSSGNALTATPEGKQKMISQLESSKNEMLDIVKEYAKVKDAIDLDSGENLSDDELETLVSMRLKMHNWKQRMNQLAPEIQDTIKQLIPYYSQYHRNLYGARQLEGESNKGITERYEELSKEEKASLNIMENLKSISEVAPELMPLMIDESVLDYLDKSMSVDFSPFSREEINTTLQKVKDLISLKKIYQSFNNKYNEYLSDPSVLEKDLEDAYNVMQQKYVDDWMQSRVTDFLTAAKDIKSLRAHIKELENLYPEESSRIVEEAFNKANEEQMQLFQNYEDIETLAALSLTFTAQELPETAKIAILGNINSIYDNSTSKEDFIKGFESFKTYLTDNGRSEDAKVIQDLIEYLNKEYESIEKAKSETVETTPEASSNGSILGNLNTVTPPQATGVIVEGNTETERANNSLDLIEKLSAESAISGVVSPTLEQMSNEGTANVSPETNNIITEQAKKRIEGNIVVTPVEEDITTTEEEAYSAQDKYGERSGTHRKNLGNLPVTEHSIPKGKNKVKEDYTPTNPTLKILQSLFKDYGTYALLNSGVIGKYSNSLDIKIAKYKNPDFKDVFFVVTELTETLKNAIEVPYKTIKSQDGKDYIIIGALNNNQQQNYSATVTKTWSEIENVNTEWAVSTSSTKIKHFYSGRIVTDVTKNLSSITTGKVLGKDYGFFISFGNIGGKYVGININNDKVQEVNSKNSSPRGGSLWLMTRGGNGVWYPSHVSIGRTNEVDWSLDNIIFNTIKEKIKILAGNGNLSQKLRAKGSLMNSIFFPAGNKLSFDNDWVSIGSAKLNRSNFTNEDEFANAILEVIKSKNLRFQITSRKIEENSTREALLNSGILKSNLSQIGHINTSFDIYGFNETPAGMNTTHTGSSEVRTTGVVGSHYYNGILYDVVVNDIGEKEIVNRETGEVLQENDLAWSVVQVFNDLSSGKISGETLKESDITIYNIPRGSYNLLSNLHVQKVNGTFEVISPQRYGSIKKKIKEESINESLNLESGGILGKLTPKGEVKAEQEDTLENEMGEPKPAEKKPAEPKNKVLDLDDTEDFEEEENETITIVSIINDSIPEVIKMQRDYNYEGHLDTDSIIELLNSHGYNSEGIKNKTTFLETLRDILQCG